MANLFQKIKSYISINKKGIINVSLSTLLFAIIIINSGYTLTYLQSDTFTKSLILIISFLIIFFIFTLTVDYTEMVNHFKSKKISWTFIALCSFAFSVLLTMFASGELYSLISYVAFGVQLLSALLIAKLVNLKKFVSLYQTGLLIVCLFSIFFQLTRTIFGIELALSQQFISFKGTVFTNHFYLSFSDISANRMQGPFWEPGLFATFILLALSFEIIFYKKIRWVYFITFFIALILTKSTFGYLLSIFIFIFLINKKIKKFRIYSFILIGVSIGVIIFGIFSKPIITALALRFPEVFSKMVLKNGEIRIIDPDRLFSPSINIQLWSKSPIWGNGLQTADRLFSELNPGMAQTSTMTFYLAQYGIFGLGFTFFFFFGLWKIKSIDVENKILLTLLFIVLFNKEPHTGILFDWILLFIFLKEGCDKDISALAYDKAKEGSVISSLNKNDEASIVKRNVTLSFIIKGIALAIGFFSYPIYRSYFNNDITFGIWLTVLSIMAMIISMDLGLGNGLKNKLIEAIVQNDHEKQKKLISSTYLSTFVISLLFLIVLTPIIFASNLNAFFGIESAIVSPLILKLSVFFVCFSICLEFFLRNVNSLLQAKQKQALSGVFALISTILLILFALIFKNDNQGFLLLAISITYIATINVPLIIGTIIVFNKYYKECCPKIKNVNKETIISITRLGLGFFIIQLLLLLLNSTNETFITALFDSSDVVEYSNYYKPFSIIAQLFSLVTLPYWAIITKEKEENNTQEIKNNIKRLLIFLGVFAFANVFLSIIFQPFVNLWLGNDQMKVNYLIVVMFNIYMFEWMCVALFSVVGNGLTIIKPQILMFGIAAFIKVVGCLVLLAFKESIGWYFVIGVNIIAYIPLIIGEIILVLKTLKNLKAKGVNNETK